MLRTTLAFSALFALLVMSLNLSATFAGNPVYAQTATATPAAEEEPADDSAEEPTEDAADDGEAMAEMEPVLTTASVSAELVQPGRALLTSRGNHWTYDSVPPINGPNEDVNPMDALLGALISCGVFIYEAVGIEQDIEITHLAATVEGELDPRGVAGYAVDPRLRAFYVTIEVDGPTVEEAAMMAQHFSTRCPIYTTLGRSAPITVVHVIDGEEHDAIATEPFTAEDGTVEIVPQGTAAAAAENDEDGTADADAEGDAAEEDLQLSRPSASARMVEFGRAMMSARGNYWIYDSVPPINGPNEEVNPMDALLGALPACALFIYEFIALEQGIALDSISAVVEGDFDPRGLTGEPVSPHLRALRMTVNVEGPTAEEAEMMADAVRVRCPIYTTLSRAAPIEITNQVADSSQAGGAVLEIDFAYDVETAEYMEAVAPLVEEFAAVDGLHWKIWTLDEESSRAGGILLFADMDALEAFLDSDLAATVTTHPALSDFAIDAYSIMAAETMSTRGPLR